MFHTSQPDQVFLFVCLLQRRRWIEYHIEKKTASSLAWKNLWNHAIAATGKKNKVCIYSVTKFPGLWWPKLILPYFSSESNSPVARLGLVYYSLYWQRVPFLFFFEWIALSVVLEHMRATRIKTWNAARVPAQKQKSCGHYRSRVLLDEFSYKRKNRKTK